MDQNVAAAIEAIPAPADGLPRQRLDAALAQVNDVLVGKNRQVRMAFACLLAGGHLLLEDVPGVGKTTLAHALAATLGLSFRRIQFTSDLLPSDIVGVSVFDRDSGEFRFQRGPIFAQLLLADEINRATPKTQSALLESMAEGQVTVDGASRALQQPFFVIATQNPLDMAGTYPLPDSQLDRFMLRIALDYPDAEAERRLLTGEDRSRMVGRLAPRLAEGDIHGLRLQARAATASPALLDYVQALLAASRRHHDIRTGLSPRAGLALLACARAWALLGDRDFVLPEDVQAVFVGVAGHRLIPERNASRDALAQALLESVPVE
ncbi:MAG TPA: MoxR family ATPase [Rhodanobacteraceae bacterium]|jgi:MoxR-like ATPase|nr:MoxR family ATPase [Rhodanobacteraceae bacterium]